MMVCEQDNTASPERQRLVSRYRRAARRCRSQGDVRQVHAALRELNRRLDAATMPPVAAVIAPNPADP